AWSRSTSSSREARMSASSRSTRSRNAAISTSARRRISAAAASPSASVCLAWESDSITISATCPASADSVGTPAAVRSSVRRAISRRNAPHSSRMASASRRARSGSTAWDRTYASTATVSYPCRRTVGKRGSSIQSKMDKPCSDSPLIPAPSCRPKYDFSPTVQVPRQLPDRERRRVERDVRVGQPIGIDRASVEDQRLDRVDAVVPQIHVHPREHPPAGEPEGVEGTLLDIAAEHDRVECIRWRVPDVFHTEVVLVGEEVRELIGDRVLAEH